MSSTVLALDIGERKIGVARANTIARIAEPLTTLANDNEFTKNLRKLAQEYQIETLVVGLPRGLDGQETAQTKYVRDFAKKLEDIATIHLQDEALTSVVATELLEEKKSTFAKEEVDALAAALILNDYLGELK